MTDGPENDAQMVDLLNRDGHEEVMLYDVPKKKAELKWWVKRCTVMTRCEKAGRVGSAEDAYMKVFQCDSDQLTAAPAMGSNECQQTYMEHQRWPLPCGWVKLHHVVQRFDSVTLRAEDLQFMEEPKRKMIQKASGMASRKVDDSQDGNVFGAATGKGGGGRDRAKKRMREEETQPIDEEETQQSELHCEGSQQSWHM